MGETRFGNINLNLIPSDHNTLVLSPTPPSVSAPTPLLGSTLTCAHGKRPNKANQKWTKEDYETLITA